MLGTTNCVNGCSEILCHMEFVKADTPTSIRQVALPFVVWVTVPCEQG